MGSVFVKTGITFEVFPMIGKIPLHNERLKRWERGMAMGNADSLNNKLIMPSRSVALYMLFK